MAANYNHQGKVEVKVYMRLTMINGICQEKMHSTQINAKSKIGYFNEFLRNCENIANDNSYPCC